MGGKRQSLAGLRRVAFHLRQDRALRTDILIGRPVLGDGEPFDGVFAAFIVEMPEFLPSHAVHAASKFDQVQPFRFV